MIGVRIIKDIGWGIVVMFFRLRDGGGAGVVFVFGYGGLKDF